MKGLITLLTIFVFLFGFAPPVLAVSPEVTQYTTDTLQIITLISTAAAVFFIVKGGYLYLTSTGRPDALEEAKKTIRNALIGLLLVLSASVIVSLFKSALEPDTGNTSTQIIELAPIETVEPSSGLVQVLIEALTGLTQNLVESATSPLIDGVMEFLTTTPSLLDNSVIMDFWLVSLGIVDALFVLVVALMGLQLMSASTLGFEEVELRQLLPKLGLAFLGANVSLFLADYVVKTCNVLVKAVLDSTGGLNHAWVTNAINLPSLVSGTAPLIILLFMIIFMIVSIVLLLLYISRLIIIALGAVLSPFIFLLWVMPKFSDMAEVSAKTYFVAVFMVFVHVVMIQLSASFLTLPEHSESSLLAIAMAIGLFVTLIKVPSLMMQMVFYTSRNGTFRKLGNQIVNVMSTDSSAAASTAQTAAKVKRRTITR